MICVGLNFGIFTGIGYIKNMEKIIIYHFNNGCYSVVGVVCCLFRVITVGGPVG
jgi:hypothetical protein